MKIRWLELYPDPPCPGYFYEDTILCHTDRCRKCSYRRNEHRIPVHLGLSRNVVPTDWMPHLEPKCLGCKEELTLECYYRPARGLLFCSRSCEAEYMEHQLVADLCRHYLDTSTQTPRMPEVEALLAKVSA